MNADVLENDPILVWMPPTAADRHHGMTQWWNSLIGPSQVFWGIAIAASILQVLMFLGSMVSGHDLDHNTGNGDGSAVDGVKLVSVRAVVAFLVGFGWAGALFLRDGFSLTGATLIAVGTGFVFMAVIFLIMRILMSLRSDGTLDYKNAIGQTGQVYVTIPGNRGGQGQVEIMIQGRLATILAVTEGAQSLAPLTPIIVRSVEGTNLLVVSPTH